MPAVIVVGSGAAGLAAALAAAGAGPEVVVLEAAGEIGGTTALSGGVVWAPGNRFQDDPAADVAAARTYLDALASGDVDKALIDVFLRDVARVVDELEVRTPLEWEQLRSWPDYRGELPGASAGGRSLWPRPLALPAAQARRLQRSPADALEDAATDAAVLRGPVRGRGLVAALLTGVETSGASVRSGVTVDEVVVEGGAVRGVRAGGETIEGRVVLASGGFQFDLALARRHLGTDVVPMGTPGCTGVAIGAALAVGATLGNVDEAWWMPAMHVPSESLGGRPFFRPLHSERAQPGSLLVDGQGRRFVDEAQNYGDVGRAMRDVGPCWLVFGAAYRRRYPLGPLQPLDPDPEWLVKAGDLDELAAAIGAPAPVLQETIEAFDRAAAEGEDPSFGRGAHPYDRWIGDPAAAHPSLAPVGEPPYYALAVHLGCMGTKGGPRTDGDGRVRRAGGGTVPGLYAAGNAAASPFGTATAAGGATLGPALTFGFRAGEAAARDR